MKNKLVFLSLLLLPALLLASGHAEGGETTKYFATAGRESDIFPRIFNFLIFAGLLYYLIADKLKAFLSGRQEGIANQLKEIENKLELAKKEEKNAQALVKDSEAKAKVIVADAKNEAVLLGEKIMEANIQDLAILDKQMKEKMDLESKKIVKDTIQNILNENIGMDDIELSNKSVVSILDRKVVA
jgi:F-type H+-transporting ATPase subunit b